MAYVGTPQAYGNPVYTLASILQGEAGNQGRTGMLAVASVMQNRANMNFSGYGGDVLSQALAPNQFQGQAVPHSMALGVANQLFAGNVQDITGGATYYAVPGDSSAAWARRLNNDNALQIGAHYFTDNTKGIPFTGNTDFANAAASQGGYGALIPTGGAGTTPDVIAPDGFNAGLPGPAMNPNSYTPPGAADFNNGLAGPLANNSGNSGPASYNLDPGIAAQTGLNANQAAPSADAQNFVSQDERADGTMAEKAVTDTSYSAQTADAKTTQQTFSKTKSSADPQSPSVPKAIDNQTKVLAQNTTATNEAIKGAAQTFQQSAKLLAQTAKDTTDKTNSSAKNIFTRATMVVTGLIFVAGGLWLFSRPDVQRAMNNAAKSVPLPA